MKLQVKDIVLSALGMALVFLATYLIKVPNGIQGYFNLGDGFILLFGSIMNPFLAFLIGGVGSALADITGGYAIYAIPTLLIKGVEGVVVALAFQHMKSKWKFSAYLVGALLMVSGYFVCDSIINESWVLGFTGIFANLLQGGIGVVIACVAYPILKRNVKNL